MNKLCLFAAFGLLAFGAQFAAGQDDPFDVKFQAPKANDDPFALPNKAGPRAKEKQAPNPIGLKSQKLAEVIRFDVRVKPSRAKPGEVVQVIITGTPKKGYHT